MGANIIHLFNSKITIMKKKKFIVSVQETLNRLVAVEAESYDKAVELVNDAWDRGTIVLDAEDYVPDSMEVNCYDENPSESDLSICKNYIDGRGLE